MPTPIRAIILDVDGVITGTKPGVNSPLPHPSVSARLAAVHASGIKVVLCTGRPAFAIREIAAQAGLDGYHITNMGTVIINPLTGTLLRAATLSGDIACAIIPKALAVGVYCELYTPDAYFRQPDADSALAEIHTGILQHNAQIAADLCTVARTRPVVKVLFCAKDKAELALLKQALSPFAEALALNGSNHPLTGERQWCAATAPGVSKENALLDVAASFGITPAQMLAIGDSGLDWEFMRRCGFVAAPANAEPHIKHHVESLPPERAFIGPHVDEHGVLAILDYFGVNAGS